MEGKLRRGRATIHCDIRKPWRREAVLRWRSRPRNISLLYSVKPHGVLIKSRQSVRRLVFWVKIIFYYVTSLLLRLLLRDEKVRKPEASVVSCTCTNDHEWVWENHENLRKTLNWGEDGECGSKLITILTQYVSMEQWDNPEHPLPVKTLHIDRKLAANWTRLELRICNSHRQVCDEQHWCHWPKSKMITRRRRTEIENKRKWAIIRGRKR